MARLSFDRKEPLRPPLRLDDDPDLFEVPAQLPVIDLLRRSAVGRDQDGNRVWDWEAISTDLMVVSYEDRTVETDDVRKLEVKLVALWEKSDVLDATDLGFSMTSVAGEDKVFRVTASEQNGFRLTLEGEAFL